ncbi:MAG: cytochrome c [Candidatus Scalindua sp.]|nr:cytochrome c [Candidatus Scalindua sp.]
MCRIKYQIFALLILPVLAMFFNGCATLQRLPEEKSADAQVYIKRCSACHAIPHPARLNFHLWKDKIDVMKNMQMPVITAKEKESVLSYINTQSKKDIKTFNLRCGRCHTTPEVEKLDPEIWENLVVVLDGNMPVFSEAERSSIIRYLQAFAKK